MQTCSKWVTKYILSVIDGDHAKTNYYENFQYFEYIRIFKVPEIDSASSLNVYAKSKLEHCH